MKFHPTSLFQISSGSLINGPVHKGTNHVPKAVSDRDLLRDWVRDLNYVHSHALQTPSRSRTGSAHCEVILFLLRSPCWLTHAWLQRAFPKCTRTNFHVPKELCIHMSSESGFLGGSRSKTPFISRFKSLIHVPKRLLEHDLFLCEQAQWLYFALVLPQGCNCVDDCFSEACACSHSSVRCWYDKVCHMISRVCQVIWKFCQTGF